MRTTVEITEAQRERLLSLANRRGLRGFSTLVQEAIDMYLSAHRAERLAGLLELEGALGAEEEEEVERRIAEAWATWRTAS